MHPPPIRLASLLSFLRFFARLSFLVLCEATKDPIYSISLHLSISLLSLSLWGDGPQMSTIWWSTYGNRVPIERYLPLFAVGLPIVADLVSVSLPHGCSNVCCVCVCLHGIFSRFPFCRACDSPLLCIEDRRRNRSVVWLCS